MISLPKGKLSNQFIPVLEAAKVLGCGPQTIETALRNGSFPIGFAFHTHTEDRNGKWHFRIPRKAFFEALETGVITKKEEAV